MQNRLMVKILECTTVRPSNRFKNIIDRDTILNSSRGRSSSSTTSLEEVSISSCFKEDTLIQRLIVSLETGE